MLVPSSVRRAAVVAAALALTVTGCAKAPSEGVVTAGGVPTPTPSASSPTTHATPSHSPSSASPSADSSASPSGEPTTTPQAIPTALPNPLPSGWVVGKPISDRRIPPGEGNAHGPNTTDKVLLTFDDCPTSLQGFKSTIEGIEALGVRVVLFPTGNCIKKGEIDIDFARDHGMFVYSHSVTHPQLSKLSEAGIRKELQPPAVQGAYVRPPFGAVNPLVRSVAKSMGMKTWLWDFDSEDWKGKPRDQVIYEVIHYTEPGDTVLMHMQWHGFDVDAVDQMKQGLAARGLQLCGLNGPATATGPLGC